MSEDRRCLQVEPGTCLQAEPDTNSFIPFLSVRLEILAHGSGGIAVNNEEVEFEHECQDQAGAEDIDEQAMGGESDGTAEGSECDAREH